MQIINISHFDVTFWYSAIVSSSASSVMITQKPTHTYQNIICVAWHLYAMSVRVCCVCVCYEFNCIYNGGTSPAYESIRTLKWWETHLSLTHTPSPQTGEIWYVGYDVCICCIRINVMCGVCAAPTLTTSPVHPFFLNSSFLIFFFNFFNFGRCNITICCTLCNMHVCVA